MRLRLLAGAFIGVIFLSSLPLPPVLADEPTTNILITELKVNNDTSTGGFNEFLEIYNNSTSSIQLSDYWLEYFNVNNPTTQSPTTQLFEEIELAPGEHYVIARSTSQINNSEAFTSITSLKDSEGTLRLLGPDPENIAEATIYDEVSWLDSSSIPEGVNKVPDKTKSLQRYSEHDTSPVAFEPEWKDAPPTPFANLFIETTPDGTGDGDGTGTDQPAISSNCEGVIINEILPNPAGSDSNHEFIELYNPTEDEIWLDNCQLQTSASNTTYNFGEVLISSGTYKAFYDGDTGLTLANSAGGTVWLLDHNDVELDQADYPANLEDDVSFALFDDGWQSTYTLTPNHKNILLSTKPCPASQIRNLDTNRCVSNVATTAGLTPCPAGKVRNPETNRCRSTTSVLSALKPCDAGQVRNPDTNRCKKVDSGDGLKPCKAGQERNPETNRCRNVAAVSGTSSFPDVKDVPAPSISTQASWWFAGVAVVGALGYGLFEWRREIGSSLTSLKSKFATSSN